MPALLVAGTTAKPIQPLYPKDTWPERANIQRILNTMADLYQALAYPNEDNQDVLQSVAENRRAAETRHKLTYAPKATKA